MLHLLWKLGVQYGCLSLLLTIYTILIRFLCTPDSVHTLPIYDHIRTECTRKRRQNCDLEQTRSGQIMPRITILIDHVMRKPVSVINENKNADQLRGNRELISAFVFSTQIIQSPYFLNPRLQASSHLLWLYSLICIGPGRKTRRPVFSQRGSINILYVFQMQPNN